MRKRRSGTIDPILDHAFGWLRSLGFSASDDPDMTVGARFATDAVVVRPSFHWHDGYADVTIARRWMEEPAPYWAQVHLQELVQRAGLKRAYTGDVRKERDLPDVFARASALLQEVAADQLAGRNLEILDDIVARRPHRGVPGLDFPVSEPWAPSQEGLWFRTKFSGPHASLDELLKASNSTDPIVRATAALELQPTVGKRRDAQEIVFGRLVDLLADVEPDVRRAAASALSEWRQVSVLDAILAQLEKEPGDAASPFAASATFLAIGRAPEVRQQVRDALDRFASRGQSASRQVEKLRWRLDDHPRQYPRLIQVWQSEPD